MDAVLVICRLTAAARSIKCSSPPWPTGTIDGPSSSRVHKQTLFRAKTPRPVGSELPANLQLCVAIRHFLAYSRATDRSVGTMSVTGGDESYYVPNKAPEHSAAFESARLQIMMDQANAPRETWEEYKAKEKAKAKEESDKMELEEKWRLQHRDQLDKDRERRLGRGTNHKDKKSKKRKRGKDGKKKKDKDDGMFRLSAFVAGDLDGGKKGGDDSSSSSSDSDSSGEEEKKKKKKHKKHKKVPPPPHTHSEANLLPFIWPHVLVLLLGCQLTTITVGPAVTQHKKKHKKEKKHKSEKSDDKSDD